jgi:hypothetical protein
MPCWPVISPLTTIQRTPRATTSICCINTLYRHHSHSPNMLHRTREIFSNVYLYPTQGSAQICSKSRVTAGWPIIPTLLGSSHPVTPTLMRLSKPLCMRVSVYIVDAILQTLTRPQKETLSSSSHPLPEALPSASQASRTHRLPRLVASPPNENRSMRHPLRSRRRPATTSGGRSKSSMWHPTRKQRVVNRHRLANLRNPALDLMVRRKYHPPMAISHPPVANRAVLLDRQ